MSDWFDELRTKVMSSRWSNCDIGSYQFSPLATCL